MFKGSKDQMPAGRQPYEPLVALRVGALAGGLAGGALAIAAGTAELWIVLAGTLFGAAAGYRFHLRHDR